jgi:hypothetical protein
MILSRRYVLSAALAAPTVIATSRFDTAVGAQTFKISHQFPGGTITEGDVVEAFEAARQRAA